MSAILTYLISFIFFNCFSTITKWKILPLVPLLSHYPCRSVFHTPPPSLFFSLSLWSVPVIEIHRRERTHCWYQRVRRQTEWPWSYFSRGNSYPCCCLPLLCTALWVYTNPLVICSPQLGCCMELIAHLHKQPCKCLPRALSSNLYSTSKGHNLEMWCPACSCSNRVKSRATKRQPAIFLFNYCSIQKPPVNNKAFTRNKFLADFFVSQL